MEEVFHIHRFKSYRLKTYLVGEKKKTKKQLVHERRRERAASKASPHKHEGLGSNHVKRRVW